MGYTNYLIIKSDISHRTWKKITTATQLLVEQSDIPVQFEYDIADPIMVNDESIRFNGVDDNGHETFLANRKHSGFRFCKTSRKPYDKIVMGVMFIISDNVPKNAKIEMSSDGINMVNGVFSVDDEFTDAVTNYKRIFNTTPTFNHFTKQEELVKYFN